MWQPGPRGFVRYTGCVHGRKGQSLAHLRESPDAPGSELPLADRAPGQPSYWSIAPDRIATMVSPLDRVNAPAARKLAKKATTSAPAGAIWPLPSARDCLNPGILKLTTSPRFVRSRKVTPVSTLEGAFSPHAP